MENEIANTHCSTRIGITWIAHHIHSDKISLGSRQSLKIPWNFYFVDVGIYTQSTVLRASDKRQVPSLLWIRDRWHCDHMASTSPSLFRIRLDRAATTSSKNRTHRPCAPQWHQIKWSDEVNVTPQKPLRSASLIIIRWQLYRCLSSIPSN